MNSRFTRYLMVCFSIFCLAFSAQAEEAEAVDEALSAQEETTPVTASAAGEAGGDTAEVDRPERSSRFWFNLDEGMWRVELSLSGGIHSGTKSRSGDTLFTSLIEYEVPVHAHGTLGLRLLPLFVYDSPTTVWGGGVGLSARLYEHRDTYEGLYVEGFAHAMYHENRFVGNSSNFNFLVGGGLGYQFPNNWHAVLRYDHFSNGGIGSRNAGVNTLGLGVGYRF